MHNTANAWQISDFYSLRTFILLAPPVQKCINKASNIWRFIVILSYQLFSIIQL